MKAAHLFLVVLLTASALYAELPPTAQEALNKGFIAAKVPDYLLAIRYFEEARKLAPDAPEIYFNLGLAESKIPGRELRAMAWFGAYLAANPAAANASAIREQLDTLEVKSQSATARLLRLAEEAAGKLPESPDDYSSKWQKLEYVAHNFVKSDDIASAQRIATLLKDRPEHRSSVLASIFQAQVDASNGTEARQTLAAIHLDSADSYDLTNIARSQLKSGDQNGARKTLGLAAKKVARMDGGEEGGGITPPWARRNERLAQVIKEQVEAGDPIGAEMTLGQFERNKRSDHHRASGMAGLAFGFARAGNAARARKYVQEARTLIAALNNYDPNKYSFGKDEKCSMLGLIAGAQVALGDRAAATDTFAEAADVANSIEDALWKTWALLGLAETQSAVAPTAAKATLAASLATAARVDKLSDRIPLLQQRHDLLAKLGVKPSPAELTARWLAMLADDGEYSSCPLQAAPFLDLTSYISSVSTDTAEGAFNGIYKATEQFVSAQNAIHKLLKEQVRL
jgi:tetratricopeptide (TPR) repeat protein